MMQGESVKAVTSSSLSQSLKNNVEFLFQFTMGAGFGDEIDTQEKIDNNKEEANYRTQLSFTSLTHEKEMPVKA